MQCTLDQLLSNTILFEGDARKRLDYVHDPLDIIRDTSAEIIPPAGLYVPVSGFGLIWRGDVSQSAGYREVLGWALAPEFGYGIFFELIRDRYHHVKVTSVTITDFCLP